MASAPSGSPDEPPASRPLPRGASGAADELPIDVDLIKVLASDSRRDILRLLGERRRTLTELADAMGLKKATVLEHLQKLVAADLIKRLDEDARLWVYYELTPRGKRLVRPERTRFFLILGGTAAAALILGAILAAAMLTGMGSQSSSPMIADDRQAFEESAPGGRVETPPAIWRGLDERAQIRVPDAPPESLLRLQAPGGASASAPIVEGVATLGAEEIDALPPGSYGLSVVSEDRERALFESLAIRDAPIALFPLAVPQNSSTTVEIALAPPAAGPPSQADVRVDGVAHKAAGVPLRVDLVAQDGRARVEVGRLYSADLVALPRFALELAAAEGNLTLRASDAGSALAGAQVHLDGELVGVTNESGALVAPLPAEGEHAIRIVAADGRAHDVGVAVSPDDEVTQLEPRLRVEAYDARAPSASGLRVRADVFNDGPADQLVTLAAREQGALLASTLVRVPAHGRADALLESPLARPEVLEVTAHAARATTVLRYSADYAASNATTYDAAGAPAPALASEEAPVTARLLGGHAADARDTLYFGPAVATAEGRMAGAEQPAPAVPLASPVVLVALVVLAALALRRRAR